MTALDLNTLTLTHGQHDLHRWALDAVPEATHDRRVVGPMIAAGNRGVIVKTGEMRRPTRRHGTPQWLWVGTHVTDLEAGAA